MLVVAGTPPLETAVDNNPAKHRHIAVLVALLTGLFFGAMVLLWFSFDHRFPGTDEAGHILNSLAYTDLLSHARPWKPAWIHKFLTVNSFYPPAVYMFSGALKLIVGTGRFVDIFVIAAYTFIASASLFGIAYLLSGSLLCGVLAASVFNLYPQVQWLSHIYMLDFPVAAMVALGVFSMLWWHQSPTWRRTAVAAVALCCACMTKQIAVAFLFPCGVWCLIQALKRPSTRNTAVMQLLAMALAVAAMALPWVVDNYQWVHQYALENAANMKQATASLVPWRLFPDYLVGLAFSMSPLLTAAFLVCLSATPLSQHKRLVPVYLSGAGGLLIISFLNWTYPLDRYATAALCCCAVVTALGASRFLAARRSIALPIVVGVLAMAVLQIISFSLTPYPLSQPSWLASLKGGLGVSLREFRGARIAGSAPVPAGADFGQSWCLATIAAVDHGCPWLNILPSDGIFNPHTFELLAREAHTGIRPTTSRRWTIEGDEVTFSPESALWFDWYLLKTGDQGNRFKDEASASQYKQLVDYVKSSGHFQLKAQKQVADGSVLSLYRRQSY